MGLILRPVDAPRKYWSTTIERTALASVKAFYCLHRIHFGGLPASDLFEDAR
jgi:hypothetical protein